VIAAIALAALGFGPATAHRIDAIVASEMRAHRTAGIAVGVVESGRLVYARGYGEANLSRRIPASPGTQFSIGQISEQFTAAAILLLAQENKLRLDDPVTKYLPQLAVARYVTVAELLDQTSGLPVVSDWPHLLRAADTARPAATPGTAYESNPLNYVVAGRIVAQVTGDTLSDFVEQHVFEPLVMDATLYTGESGASPNRAVGYTLERGTFVRARPWSATRLDAGAGAISDVYDLAKWDIEFPILLRVDAVRDMFTPGVPGAFVRYGMGWTIDERSGHRFMWQNGEVPGFHAMNAILPDDHVAVIVLSNTDSLHEQSAMPEIVAGRILDAVVPPSPQRVDNAILVRARAMLVALQRDRIDRTELTPEFSRYLSDDVVRNARLSSLGRLVSLVPISSRAQDGDTTYEFLALFAAGERHYRVTLTPDGKVAFLSFSP
jgi:D-alanyl-D-alanine carboxypeptidase